MRLGNDREIAFQYSLRDTSKADEMVEYADHEQQSSRISNSGYHFEFITSADQLQSDLCPADDIFVSGKLLPFKHQTDFRKFPIMQINSSPIASRRGTDHVDRKRSESSSDELNPTFPSSSNGIKIKRQVVRNSSWKSDESSVSSNSSTIRDLDRSYSHKSNRTSSGSPKMSWQSFIYGMRMVKYPVEMELRDMKHRQSRRRRPASILPATLDSAGGGRGTASWGLIKALSCKDHTCTSINASFVLMPHV